MEKILKDIVEKRKETIREKGLNFGINLPEKRITPLIIPELSNGIIITEIKRGSPSEGKMNSIDNPLDWVSSYKKGGANVISVLTEEEFFFGSLNDLITIKNNYPDITVLRKDFLLYEEEIEISYRAGADMILLIAAILDTPTLKKLKEKAESFGILPLIEVHNEEELKKIAPLAPKLIGINSRNLDTFVIDRNYPTALKSAIPKESYVVFESGIRNGTDSFFTGVNGFDGILVGTSIVKGGDAAGKINELKDGFFRGRKNRSNFFQSIFKKIYMGKKIAVKVCGITNIEDALLVKKEGADIVGFIFADSPRKIDIEKAKEISLALGDEILKVGVVVDKEIEKTVNAVKEGWLDAIQFHGDMTNEECMSYGVCWYKAIRVSGIEDFSKNYYCPFMLYDTFSMESMGGTGKTIKKELLDYAIEKKIKLFLAGGITPENVLEIISAYHPALIDLSSGLEKTPGKKDPDKVIKFFKTMREINQ